MKKIIDYDICECQPDVTNLSNRFEFVMQIKSLIKEGWQPYGSLTCRNFNKDDSRLVQAMVKYEE